MFFNKNIIILSRFMNDKKKATKNKNVNNNTEWLDKVINQLTSKNIIWEIFTEEKSNKKIYLIVSLKLQVLNLLMKVYKKF